MPLISKKDTHYAKGNVLRYKLTIEYDGTDFCGWQRQHGQISVQQVLEEALAICTRGPVTLFGCGRTDAGVHALGQVAHFDLVDEVKPFMLQASLNALVRPHNVCVKAVERVSDDFHARFSARQRTYVYKIQNTVYPAVLNKNRAWHCPRPLNENAMQQAANLLLGEHDFSTFRDSQCQAKSPIKTIDFIAVCRVGDMIEIEVQARSFLHHQIRNIAGSLVMVGRGTWSVDDFKTALESCDRTKGGPTAPPQGLYFGHVDF